MNIATVLGWLLAAGSVIALVLLVRRWKPKKESNQDWLDRQW